jgi:hypothetical protein
LSKTDDLDTEMDRLEDLRAALLSVENPFSGHYVLLGDVDSNVVVDHGLSYGSKETAARLSAGLLPSGGAASEGWTGDGDQPGYRWDLCLQERPCSR